MTSYGIARKAYLVITFVITLPLCFAFYYFSEQQKMLILMENEREMTRVSITLVQQLPHNGKALAYWEATDISDSSFIQDVRAYFQSYVDDMVTMYPYYRVGIYHRDLDRVVAMYPSAVTPDFISINDPEIVKVFETGEPAMVTMTNSRVEQIPRLASLSPIYHLGKVVGVAWVSKRIDYVLSESDKVLIKGIIIIFCVWALLMFIVQAVFHKLDISLIRFACQITNNEISTVEFEDFPQLKSLFDTVVSLRENLKLETEHYLEESQKLKKLIELTPLAIVVVDKNGVVTACNQSFLRYHPEHDRETIKSLQHNVFADGTCAGIEETVITRALRGEEIHDEYGFFLNRYWISNAFPLKNNEGEITGAIAICHDITEHEKMRKDIIKLDRLNIVGQMAASVAHEVRNPMTVIRGYIQVIKKKTGETYSSQFNTIIAELDRANRIISDYLSLARDKYVEKKSQSLSKIIQDVFPLVESEALARNISCHGQFEDNIPVLMLNSEEIKQLILNLSMNALDALSGGGELTISCAYNEAGREVELKIRDTGCGMDAVNIERVFEPFYTTKKNGSGLGLPICKSIVERHGGYINLQSEWGKGSVFDIRFPCNND